MSEHDEHSTFIKTPQQLVVIVLLAFVVPIIGITLLVKLVVEKPGADPGALTPQSVTARIQPVGKIAFGDATADAPKAPRGGEEVYKAVCAACHQAGVANAPKVGDKAAWAKLVKASLDTTVQSAIKGKGAMPPRGGVADLSDLELTRAIVFMANQSGGKYKEPAALAAVASAAAAPAAAQTAAQDPKKIYDGVCVACHAQSVAGSPKLGDKAAWAPRIKTGVDALVKTVLAGKGAMPPKGGNAALSEADIRGVVEFMVSQSK
jgi:cytochrome c5